MIKNHKLKSVVMMMLKSITSCLILTVFRFVPNTMTS
jgi:hypothetical protein